MDVYMCDVGDQEMKLQLRALDESLAESTRLHKLVELAGMEPGGWLHRCFCCSAVFADIWKASSPHCKMGNAFLLYKFAKTSQGLAYLTASENLCTSLKSSSLI